MKLYERPLRGGGGGDKTLDKAVGIIDECL